MHQKKFYSELRVKERRRKRKRTRKRIWFGSLEVIASTKGCCFFTVLLPDDGELGEVEVEGDHWDNCSGSLQRYKLNKYSDRRDESVTDLLC